MKAKWIARRRSGLTRIAESGKLQKIIAQFAGHPGRAIREAELFAAHDKEKKQLQQVKDKAESLLNRAKKIRKKLSSNDRIQLEKSIADLERALKTDRESDILSSSESLENVLHYADSDSDSSVNSHEDGAYDA